MSGSGHYPLLSHFHRRVAVQFCSSAELNPEQRFLRRSAGDLSWQNVLQYLAASCLKVIRPWRGRKHAGNQDCEGVFQAIFIYVAPAYSLVSWGKYDHNTSLSHVPFALHVPSAAELAQHNKKTQ